MNRVNASGSVLWGSSGVLICNAAGEQLGARTIADGSGGAITTWMDPRTDANYDLYTQRVNSAGVVQWTPNGVAVCTQAGIQRDHAIAPDGSGGVIIAWNDHRTGAVGGQDIYAQRVNAAGTPMWATDGVAVCNASGIQVVPTIVSDGAGGAIISWWDLRGPDKDVYAQRLDGSGAALWAANGIQVAGGTGDQHQTTMVADGANGALLAWEDFRAGAQSDIYAQHLDGSGAFLWGATGKPVCTESHSQLQPQIARDGFGGGVIAWGDTRSVSGGSPEAYVQKLGSSGDPVWQADGVFVDAGPVTLDALNRTPAPDGSGGAIVSTPSLMQRILQNGQIAWTLHYQMTWQGVFDEPFDQGGMVQLRLNGAPFDIPGASPVITMYNVWRRIPGSTASTWRLPSAAEPDEIMARAIAGEPMMIDASANPGTGFPPGLWESLGSHPAMRVPTYILAAPTHDDFTGTNQATEVFVVSTHVTPNLWVVSYADSGYSVDNLAPGVPQGVAGSRSTPGTVQLTWSANPERDVVSYGVYKGTSSGFVPSSANRLGSPTSPGWTDPAFDPSTSYYKISALDRHGNESSFALLAPSEVTDVGPGPVPSVSFLGRPAPNPGRSPIVWQYGLAQAGRVEMEILDLRGRVVKTLVDRQVEAGTHSAEWDGRDQAGRATPAGVYWIRFATDDVRESRRVVRLQ